ncbi:hypothetical protein GOBAR_AA37509 [Gossypium barbadense]|uniref:Uncharacterized protein n=1 Tax=Gossypium barbadense TaxID=3634 RepID=A0A2P5VWJ9_GOSBA|nr:hypothetical protein GOBAR_AA37509 [Gossypium barbadense]
MCFPSSALGLSKSAAVQSQRLKELKGPQQKGHDGCVGAIPTFSYRGPSAPQPAASNEEIEAMKAKIERFKNKIGEIDDIAGTTP